MILVSHLWLKQKVPFGRKLEEVVIPDKETTRFSLLYFPGVTK
jgi:hypothetical protein